MEKEYGHTGFLEVNDSPEDSETKFKNEGEWYFDDEQLDDLYLLMEQKTLNKDKATEMLESVEEKITELSSKTDKTIDEENKLGMATKVATELSNYVKRQNNSETSSDIIEHEDSLN